MSPKLKTVCTEYKMLIFSCGIIMQVVATFTSEDKTNTSRPNNFLIQSMSFYSAPFLGVIQSSFRSVVKKGVLSNQCVTWEPCVRTVYRTGTIYFLDDFGDPWQLMSASLLSAVWEHAGFILPGYKARQCFNYKNSLVFKSPMKWKILFMMDREF